MSSSQGYIRRSSHAGTWYTSSGVELKAEVEGLMKKARSEQDKHIETRQSTDPVHKGAGVDLERVEKLRSGAGAASKRRVAGLYGPHAGIRYCGLTHGHVYAVVEDALRASGETSVKRIFVMGQTHYRHMNNVVYFSGASAYAVPWGSNTVQLPCDTCEIGVLKQKCTGKLAAKLMDQDLDEEEHVIELHIPFVTWAIENLFNGLKEGTASASVSIIPILIGHLDSPQLNELADLLFSYFLSPDNFFCFSSDFSHWGARFGYTFQYQKDQYPMIGDGIRALNLKGIDYLSKLDLNGWEKYIAETRNTVCGRFPLSVMLALANRFASMSGAMAAEVVPVHLSWSETVVNPSSSSVTYAGGVISLESSQ